MADTNNPIIKVEWANITSLNITLLDGTVCKGANPGSGNTATTAVPPALGIYAGTSPSFTTLYTLSKNKWNGNLEKAGWNYRLSFEEGRDLNEAVAGEFPGEPVTQQPAVTARGVHNPAFSILMLQTPVPRWVVPPSPRRRRFR